MARFNFNAPAATANTNDESWKAKAFLNIWVKRADGSRAKIGAIPLKEQRAFDKALIERLQQDGGVLALMAAMEIDFQMADKPTSQVNLGF